MRRTEQIDNFQTENILIVDDDHDTCQLLEILFQREGYRTAVANGGQQALDHVETAQPDLVVLDVMMPGMDGWETFRRLRDISSAPVLFLTAMTSGESAAMALQMGAGDYMRKPYSVQELLARIKTLLARPRDVSESSSTAHHQIGDPSPLPAITSDQANADDAIELPPSDTKFRASIVLPAYNEALAIPQVLQDLHSTLNGDHEIIVVDDGSSDDTAAVASQYTCRVIRHEQNMGKGAAIQTGIKHAQGTFVVVMDADATYPANAVPQLISMLEEYDLVRCIRKSSKETMPAINQVGNKLFDFILTKVGVDAEDHLSGLYGLRRAELLGMDLDSDGFDIEAEISIKAKSRKLKTITFPIEYQPRLGEKKLKPWRDGWRILSRILLSVLIINPVFTFIYPGLMMMLLAGIGALVLRESSFVTPYFGLSVHSFILAAVGLLAGFQLVIFGMAASLYGIETGIEPPAWLVHASSRLPRLGVAAAGSLMSFIAALQILTMFLGWVIGGAGDFIETRRLVLNSALLVWGLQLLSASLFLSIFAGRLQKKTRRTTLVELSA